MASSFRGGFAQGLANSNLTKLPQTILQLQQAKEQKEFQKEQLDLQKKKFDLDEKESDLRKRVMEKNLAKDTRSFLEKLIEGAMGGGENQSGGSFSVGVGPGGVEEKRMGDPFDAIRRVQERMPPGVALSGGGLSVSNPQPSQPRQLSPHEQALVALSSDPETGRFDAKRYEEVYKRFQTNPQGAESRFAGYIIEREKTGIIDPAMEKAMKAYQSFVRGTARDRSGGKVEGETDVRSTTKFQETEGDVAAARGKGAVRGRTEFESSDFFQQVQSDIKRAEAEGATAGRPLGEAVIQKGAAMKQSVRIVDQIMSEFTPEERAKYVGFFRFPANRIAQIAKGDKRFADFQVLINQAKGAAFGEGGKQLTPFEASVVFGYVPSGKELSAADFEAKLQNTLRNTPALYNDMIGLSRTPRGKLEPLVPQQGTAGKGGGGLPPGWEPAN